MFLLLARATGLSPVLLYRCRRRPGFSSSYLKVANIEQRHVYVISIYRKSVEVNNSRPAGTKIVDVRTNSRKTLGRTNVKRSPIDSQCAITISNSENVLKFTSLANSVPSADRNGWRDFSGI